MTTRKTHNGTAYARNPYVQFDEGEVVPAATSRRGSGKFTYATLALPVLLAVVTFGQEAADTYTFIDLLTDVIFKPGSYVKVVDLDELSDAVERSLGYDPLDPVAAWSKGGTTDEANCQMLCRTHNRAKGNR